MPSVSDKQRRFMGLVMAIKKRKKKKASPEAMKAAKSMSMDQVKDMMDMKIRIV